MPTILMFEENTLEFGVVMSKNFKGGYRVEIKNA